MAKKIITTEDPSEDFLSSMLEVAEGSKFAEDGISGDVTEFIDTGSYAFNAALSGSMAGGIASNKTTALAGPESVGKSYLVLDLARAYQKYHNDQALIVDFETEGGRTTKLLNDRGFVLSRYLPRDVVTVQEFRTKAAQMLDKYKERVEAGNAMPMLFILDSLGNLSTNKEVEDIVSGEDKRDMTRQQLIRGAFRVLTLKASALNVPILVTNHVYDVTGAYIPTKEMSGGGGLKYAASTIVFLTKKKDRDDKTKEIYGNIITTPEKPVNRDD